MSHSLSRDLRRVCRIEPTPEKVYRGRREFLRQLGFGGLALVAGSSLLAMPAGCGAAEGDAAGAVTILSAADAAAALRPGIERAGIAKLYPAARQDKYKIAGKLTDPLVAATHNNFYEFTTDKSAVWRFAQKFEPDPWTVEVAGLCDKPAKFGIDDVYKLAASGGGGGLEERTYRFRCVEAWAMDVPWTGFPLARLLTAVGPWSDAKFVRFVSVNRPEQMIGIRTQNWYPWPYFEGLRMDEAMNELTLLATGVYGRPLPRQHGAPFRVIVPWKYGYKSAKSIVRIELLDKQPKTFWETVAPDEYPFESNINPKVPHPRWSQASETVIGAGERRPTLPLGGYGEFVGKLYA